MTTKRPKRDRSGAGVSLEWKEAVALLDTVWQKPGRTLEQVASLMGMPWRNFSRRWRRLGRDNLGWIKLQRVGPRIDGWKLWPVKPAGVSRPEAIQELKEGRGPRASR